MVEAKCICCDKAIKPAGRDESPWDMPAGAVLMDGGNSFGSTLYDTLMDGVTIRIIICDDCLIEHKSKVKEYKIE